MTALGTGVSTGEGFMCLPVYVHASRELKTFLLCSHILAGIKYEDSQLGELDFINVYHLLRQNYLL